MKFVFDIYDFDNDNMITKSDITTIITCMPVIGSRVKITREGKFTQEGGGASTFQERVNSLEEMTQILDICFGDRTKINFNEFSSISEQKTSDMVLAVLSLLRERLPCSENYWRYKRNYEMHMKILEGDQMQLDSSKPDSNAPSSHVDEESKSDGSGAVKRLAKAHMSLIMPLSPYAQKNSDGSAGSRPDSPSNVPMGDVPMSEEEVADKIPLQNLKSN